MSIDELRAKILEEKKRRSELMQEKKQLADRLYNAAKEANLWKLAYHAGKIIPKQHGDYRELVFRYDDTDIVTVTLDTYNGFLMLRLNGILATMGETLKDFEYYMSDDTGVVKRLTSILEDIAQTDIPELGDLAGAATGTRYYSKVIETIKTLLGVEEA